MLDLTKVAMQMPQVGQLIRQGAMASRQKQAQALEVLAAMADQLDNYRHRLATWRNHLAFAVAEPIEPLSTLHTAATAVPPYTVIAVDGSQIAPSRHEIAYCYLINIGRVAITYGSQARPRLESLPQLVYDPAELGQLRSWGITTEDWLRYRRTQAELLALTDLAIVASPETPTLALVDGSLIFWDWATLPAPARKLLLAPILEAWQQLRSHRIPLVGYVSASRSHETLNFLRLGVCPYAEPNCAEHCAKDTERPPCQIFDPLRDTLLWQAQLKPQQYSPLWRSYSPILEHYGDHAIYCCYLHVGTEVVRLEFPQWVAQDQALLQQAVTLTISQVEKGRGYPVALAEAHHLAVVRAGDRQRFFALLERELIKAGQWHVAPSPKEQRKRQSIA